MHTNLDTNFSRYSNCASAPLPLIPRRSTSSSRISSLPIPSKLTTINVQPPTPPDDPPSRNPFEDSDTSSSSTSEEYKPTIFQRSKGIRQHRIPPLHPPELSTPTPAVYNANPVTPTRRVERAGDISRNTENVIDDDTPRPHPEKCPVAPCDPPPGLDYTDNPSELHLESIPVHIPPAVETLVRKKSGQPVKSSLKSSKPQPRGSLCVVTRGMPSKSEPSTPTHTKAVHFDAHLEHVKLFLAEQKPLAVSRDGSPTDDTSGTDNDFPSFIYDESIEDTLRKKLTMQVTNMPLRVNIHSDVALEQLVLSQDTTCILGNVRVRNIDFQKWLAVRFTFDSWQTTSEVVARYIKSLDSDFDRFAFTIRLNDLLARIEEKTLILAIRYTVQGREIWDNNGGRNYIVRFTKPKAIRVRAKSEGVKSNAVDYLKTKLENVIKAKEHAAYCVFENEKPLDFKTSHSLASRYDFTTSSKSPWKPPPFLSPPRRAISRPASPPLPRNSIPWPTMRTPEAAGDDRNPLYRLPSLGKAKITPQHRSSYICGSDSGIHRRGFSDIASPQSIKKNLTGAHPLHERHMPKKPLSLVIPHPTMPEAVGSVPERATSPEGPNSGESTPSIISSSTSSRSLSPSPSEMFMTHLKRHHSNGSPPPSDNLIDYGQLLNKYCFYTGAADHLLDIAPEAIPRSQSASNVEALLSTSSSPPLTTFSASHFKTPPRTQSFDDNTIYKTSSPTPTHPPTPTIFVSS